MIFRSKMRLSENLPLHGIAAQTVSHTLDSDSSGADSTGVMPEMTGYDRLGRGPAASRISKRRTAYASRERRLYR